MKEYNISSRLTFSNSLLREEHLSDKKCNDLCKLFSQNADPKNGVIIYSDLLLSYLKENYPHLYFVSSTTKVLTEFSQLVNELDNDDFSYVVPDFRLNKALDKLSDLSQLSRKTKWSFFCNECCYIGCADRKNCYENVSHKNLGENCPDHVCNAPNASEGYRFSKAMESPAFIGIEDIQNTYLPMGFSTSR